MQVRWLRKALRSLEQTHQHIAKDNPEAATRTVVKIQAAVNQLKEFPSMGRSGRIESTRDLVIPNTPYIVVYRVKEDSVEILRVLHSSRRYPGRL